MAINVAAGSRKKLRTVEKIFERRRLIFHVRDGKVFAAFGQTAGGWGRVEEPEKLAQRLLNRGDLRFDRHLGHGD